MGINWKQKLSSRKFWALGVALAVSIMAGVFSPESIERISGIITSVGACAVYMLSEAHADAHREEKKEHENQSANH